MDLHEFELRYKAYIWLNNKFHLGRKKEELINLVKISDQGIPDRKIQEITPDELKKITLQTYSNYKREFLKKSEKKNITDIDKTFTLKEYIERLEYELKVIKEMWFNSYFLIVSDFVQRSKQNHIIVWPWRWSWAWSLLAWLIQITDINPLPYGLLFERFLNPARITMPDFDIDFEDQLREEVIKYVTEKYGNDKVCAIWTYMTMATKAAFKDAARALWVPFDKSNFITNMLPEGKKLKEILEISAEENYELYTQIENDPNIKKALQFGEKLEWNLRQLWVHACGIIIAPDPITTYSAIQYVKDDPKLGIVSQYAGPTTESLWLLKMDFLWLRNLSVIKNCIRIITKKYELENKKLPKIFQDFRKSSEFHPPLNEKHTFDKVFKIGNTTGIFQFESAGMRKNLIALEADSINDLTAMNALYRPWPMESIPNYIERKHWREKIFYMQAELKRTLIEKYDETVAQEEEKKLIEDLDPIMNVTYGIAVYQEQLMFLVQAMAGFSLAEADILRRGVGKKKKEVIEQVKKEFIKKSKSYRNYKEETAIFIYEKMIEPAASYSFNKSHSVCYSIIAYQTAYLKAHFPIEFYASLIRSVEEDTDELSNYIYEAQLQWIEILTPDISQSFNHVAAINNKIRLWFLWIKWIGREIGEFIQEERKAHGAYTNFEDFLKRCHSIVNKKSIESLTKAGAFDEFADRNTILHNINQVLERAKWSQTMSMGLFGEEEMTKTLKFSQNYNTNNQEKMLMEYDVFKTFVSIHPLDGLYQYLKKFSFISQFKNVENYGPFEIIGYIKSIQRARKKWFFLKIEDVSNQIEIFVKDILDFKKFDILIINWYKGRGVSFDKIIKTSREQLIQEAWKKYDPHMTITKVKKLRLWEDLKALYNHNHSLDEKLPKEDMNNIKDNDTKDNDTKNNNTKTNNFLLAEKIEDIQKTWKIIKVHPWNIPITIGWKDFSIDSIGLQQLQDILKSIQ